MNTSLGYSKKTLTNSNVLLSGGGDKALSEFIGSLNWDSTNKKLQYKSASSTNFTDLITFGSNAFTSYSGYNIVFLNNEGTTIDTFKALTSPNKTLKAGTNVQMTAASNVITITATDTTYSVFTGASSSAAGSTGLVKLPSAGDLEKFLRGDSTWQTVNLNVTSALYVGASNGTGNSAQSTNGNVYLIFAEGSSYSRYKIVGSGRASVTSDANGNITINSSGYSNFSAATATAAGSAGLVPAPGANILGTGGYFLRADGSWVVPTNTWKAANSSQEGYVPKSTANKILRANANGALYWGDDANTTYTFYNLQFQNSGGTTVDTYKPTTTPTKTLKAGSNVTISAASNVITIASTNTWNANAVGVAGYVAAPTKAANANMVWKTDSDGNPAWRADANDNTLYYLTLNGTVNGTSGKTNLGTFYAVATSDTTTANQVWMRNSNNNGYGWRTLGSHAFDSTTYSTTDKNVKQTPKTDNVNRPLMMINGGTSAGEQTSTSIFSTGIYANASTKMIIASGFVKTGSDDTSVLLAGGGEKLLSDFFYHKGFLYQNNNWDADTLGIGSWSFKSSGYGGVGSGAAHTHCLSENSIIEVFRNVQLSATAWSDQLSYRVSWDRESNSARPNGWGPWLTIARTSDIPTKSSWNYDDVYSKLGHKHDSDYVQSVSISGNNLRVTKNNSNSDLTIPYATSAGSATTATRFAYANNWNVGKGINTVNLITCEDTAATGAPSAYTSGISIMTSYVGFQLCTYGGASETLYFRKLEDNGTWHNWYEVITGANIGSQSVNYATSAGNVGGYDITKLKTRLYNAKLITKTSSGPGWYRLVDCTTSSMTFLITFYGGYNYCQPTPVTFLVSHSYSVTTISQIGRCAYVGWITSLRAVHHDTYKFYIDVYFAVGGADTAGNMVAFEITPLDPNYTNYTLIDYTKQSDGNGDAKCDTSTSFNADYASSAGNADTLDGYHATCSGTPWGSIPYICESGWMEVGNSFEMHYDNTTGSDYSTRLYCTGNYGNSVALPSTTGTIALTTDNVASATKLQTARTIWGQSFDGTGNVDGTLYIKGSSNWCEGIRINNASNGWTTIILGASGTSGTNANAWSFHTYQGNFYLNRNGSDNHTGYEMCNVGGNWGISTNSPSYKLHVNGNVGASNYYTTSDRSKKQNISSFSEHIRKFQLKNTEKWHYGVIAQEVPEMFRDGEEGSMTVNYNSVLSYYVGLLENRVKELELEVLKLKMNNYDNTK